MLFGFLVVTGVLVAIFAGALITELVDRFAI
jgi:hypothetical protein